MWNLYHNDHFAIRLWNCFHVGYLNNSNTKLIDLGFISIMIVKDKETDNGR